MPCTVVVSFSGLGMQIMAIRCMEFLSGGRVCVSVSSVVEFPGAGSSRLRTINSELNGAT